MRIELRGLNTTNKGAELMLHSIIQYLSNKKDLSFVVDHTTGTYLERAKLGLHQKLYLPKLGVRGNAISGKLIPQKLRKRYGLIPIDEIDVIIDASGFAYSDQWGTIPVKNAAEYFEYQKQRNKKVILMPQAFGPFKNEETKKYMKKLLSNVDLVFARDLVSYENLKELEVKTNNIVLSPDFTVLLKYDDKDDFKHLIGKGCIVPNYRMIDKMSELEKKNYIDYLVSITNFLTKNQKNEFFYLIHDKGKDLELAKEILSRVDQKFEIVEENNPLLIKSIISNSKFTIGSRFHGLVSALSNGVPSLGIGWSHKYRMLFEDYEVSQYVIDINKDLHSNQQIFQKFLSEIEKKDLQKKLIIQSQKQKEKTKAMWNKVENLIF
ncbi:polysaccharide pyruvyl transferase family protein [Paraliobacillus ryukyuensis]|uniref:polysaccharide pyruvyl transferase family protein n=1 Tax=Paraliobacillus ryukyuensis TaxID=200904 RepID=UPI0009A89C1B|nr:polysaccharide pyruvyl transferase family protein [Paraliobacillus ryukyuensis]